MGNFSKYLNQWAGFSSIKGPGHCVICGTYGALTWDHVPPKSCVPLEPAVLCRLSEDSYGSKPIISGPKIQGGLKFKTLCARCNSHLLGQLYDVELLKFVDGFHQHLRGISPTKPVAPIVLVQANLHAVARSVIGHLLAAHSIKNTQQFRENIGASESLRQYFLDADAPFPNDWRLLCWPYFHPRQVILRHTVWKDIASDHGGIYGHLLKFSPFAFWFINDAPEILNIGAQDITPAGNDNTQLDSVYFPMFRVPNALFPELPTNNTFLLLSESQSSIARPYRNPNYTKKSPGKSKQ